MFKCGAELAWIYVLAELLAAVLACSIFAFVSGFGPLNPLKSTAEFGLSWPEAVQMWFTGAILCCVVHTGHAGSCASHSPSLISTPPCLWQQTEIALKF